MDETKTSRLGLVTEFWRREVWAGRLCRRPRFGNRQKVGESRFERIRRARTAQAENIGDDKRLCTRPPLCDQFPAAGFDSPAELVRKLRQRICMVGPIVSIEKLFVLFAQFIERGFLLAAVFGFVLLAGRKCKFRQPVPCGDISRLFAGQRGESTFLDVDISLACSRPRSKLGYFRAREPAEREMTARQLECCQVAGGTGQFESCTPDRFIVGPAFGALVEQT